jgi:predicted AAA+ superfamily ATPase
MLSKIMTGGFQRELSRQLAARLSEPRRFLQAVTGPRQVGKTTLVRQAVASAGLPAHYVSLDEPGLRDTGWLAAQWELARHLAHSPGGACLVLDEVQKLPAWSEAVKRLWDEDSTSGCALQVVLLGSAPLLVQRGLSESLAGRFEVLSASHWSWPEMHAAFGMSLEEYVYFGGYPGAATLRSDPDRWRRYVLDSLVETTLSRDLLLLTRVDKPALLRQLFDLGCRYSGQVLSYTKMLGQLQDAGNATTLAHYLALLAQSGLMCGLQKFAGQAVRSRGSIPKLQVFNTALLSAGNSLGPTEVRADAGAWGRLVESAVGAHLANAMARGECELFYWRESNREVDFVVRRGSVVAGIEVKSGAARAALPGLAAFGRAFHPRRVLLVGQDGIPLEEFLSRPVTDWLVA